MKVDLIRNLTTLLLQYIHTPLYLYCCLYLVTQWFSRNAEISRRRQRIDAEAKWQSRQSHDINLAVGLRVRAYDTGKGQGCIGGYTGYTSYTNLLFILPAYTHLSCCI